jgi:hypothetical protein
MAGTEKQTVVGKQFYTDCVLRSPGVSGRSLLSFVNCSFVLSAQLNILTHRRMHAREVFVTRVGGYMTFAKALSRVICRVSVDACDRLVEMHAKTELYFS